MKKKLTQKLIISIVILLVVLIVVLQFNGNSGLGFSAANSGFNQYTYKGNVGYSYEFNEESFKITAPNGYVWSNSVEAARIDTLTENQSWKNYMKSLVAVDYYDTSSEAVESKRVYSSDTNAAKVTGSKTDNGFKYKINFHNLFLSLELELSFNDGALSAKIPSKSIKENGNCKIVAVEVLPFLGAEGSQIDGYIMYPDGSGALMEYSGVNKRPDSMSTQVFKIYGNNEKIDTDSNFAFLPVFGIKNANNAFLATVTTGDCDTYLRVTPENVVVDLNRAAFQMQYRYFYEVPSSDIATGSTYSSLRIDKERGHQDFEAIYIFLQDEAANYSGMATAYRGFLKENGKLNKSEYNSTVSLGLLMGVTEKQAVTNKAIAVTDFNDAENIITELNKKNISNIDLMLLGWEKSGPTVNIKGFNPWKILGGKSGLKKLSEKAKALNIPITLVKNFSNVTSDDKGYSAYDNVVYAGNGFALTDNYKKNYILNIATQNEYFDKYISKVSKYSFGTAAMDIGKQLSNDYRNASAAGRTEAAEALLNILKKSAENGKTDSFGANLYTFISADTIRDLPDCSSGLYICDKDIPFVQMVLHGNISYTGKPINLFYDEKLQLLGLVEYGFTPYYELTTKGSFDLKFTESKNLSSSKFSLWEDSVVNTYGIFEKLSSVRKCEIISHSNNGDSAVLEYSNGSKLYINYSETEAVLCGVTVPAKDFILVK